MHPHGPPRVAPPEDHPIRVLFEDDDFLAVDKPEGLASIPERDPGRPCLVRILGQRTGRRLFVVHRLDKGASGVLLFAKTPQAHRVLNDQFSTRRVAKRYLALVHGVMAPEAGVIRTPLRLYGSGRMGVHRGGKPCVTGFEMIEPLPRFTLLEVRPETGRRHQIRAHLYSIGHPVVGDTRYGPRQLQEEFPRLMLHAAGLRFTSPSGKEISIESPLPASFSSVLERLRARPGPEGRRTIP